MFANDLGDNIELLLFLFELGPQLRQKWNSIVQWWTLDW